MDSRAVRLVSSLSVEQSARLQTDFMTFDPVQFASKCREYGTNIADDMGEQRMRDYEDAEEVQWDKMGALALKYMRRAPGLDFMLGPMSVSNVTKKRAVAQRRARDLPTEAERVVSSEQTDVNEGTTTEDTQQAGGTTQREVSRLMRVIKQQPGPVNFFALVCNPDSFSQTVENVFHLAFLIKEGHASVFVTPQQPVPHVEVTNVHAHNESGQEGAANVEKRQVLVSMDMQTWKRACSRFNIVESMVPHRPSTVPTR